MINVIKFVVVHCVRTVPTQVRQIPKTQVGRFNSGLLCRSQEAINLTVWKVRIEAARVHWLFLPGTVQVQNQNMVVELRDYCFFNGEQPVSIWSNDGILTCSLIFHPRSQYSTTVSSAWKYIDGYYIAKDTVIYETKLLLTKYCFVLDHSMNVVKYRYQCSD